MRPLPFYLPSEPVNRWKVRWVTWEIVGSRVQFTPFVATFYQHATWDDVFPNWRDWSPHPGVPFEREWMVLKNGYFQIRCGAFVSRLRTVEAWPSIACVVDERAQPNMRLAAEAALPRLKRVKSSLESEVRKAERELEILEIIKKRGKLAG